MRRSGKQGARFCDGQIHDGEGESYEEICSILIVMAMLLPLLVSCGGNEAKPTGTDTPHSGEDKQDTGKQVATAELSPDAMLC